MIPQAVTAQKRVLKQLLSDITSGTLKPNEKLNEDALALRYKVSRTPLRTAIRQLAAEGLIETIPHKGARISPITMADVHDSLEIHKILNCHAIRLVCQHISESELRRLYKTVSDMDAAHLAGNFIDNYAHLREYQLTLLKHMHNRHLERAAKHIIQRFGLLRFLLVHSTGMGRLLPTLKEVLVCIEKRDPDAAEHAMKIFLTTYMEIVFEEIMATHPQFEPSAATKQTPAPPSQEKVP